MVQDIIFDIGEISKVFTVNIINDTVAESDESFEVFLKLIPDSSDVIIGEPSVATGTIFDDEIPSKTFTISFHHASTSTVYNIQIITYVCVLYFCQAYKVLLFVIAVRFLSNSSSADESDGSISFTIISSVASDSPFTVQVCTRDIVPLSAEGSLKVFKYTRCFYAYTILYL